MAYRAKSVAASWRAQSPATKLLRLWLGITWIYGGWDKASDPSFLTPGTVNYIGNQIRGFVEISPLGSLLNNSLEHATLVGWLVLITEFATGIATILFIAPRFAAFVGFSTSVGLWLTVTFHVKPYFLGSDTAYAIMWLAYLLILQSGSNNINNMRLNINMERRGFLRLGSVFGITGGFIGLGQLFPKKEAAVAATGKKIIKLEVLPIGGNHKFKASNGEPAMVFRTKNGIFAYSLICTHQGCTVGYSGKQLVCPCHGASFDPLKGAKVTGGPAPRPLKAVKVKISGAYVVEA
jgi:thiosulfate dehydrogenase [quinone] large subunit